MRLYRAALVLLFLFASCTDGDDTADVPLPDEKDFWPYSYVDDLFTSGESGADGVDLIIDIDGTYYVATAWQDSNAIRACRNTADLVRDYWECVTVGENESPEFAFFASIFSDGIFDVISCGKGGIHLHVAPGKEDYLKPEIWQSYVISICRGCHAAGMG